MKLKNAAICLTLGWIVSLPVVAAEPQIPTDSIGAVGVFVAYEKFRIYSEVCSEVMPESKAEFEGILDALTTRMRRFGAELLETPPFKAMRAQPVPPSLSAGIRQDLESTWKFHRTNASNMAIFSRNCRRAHDDFKSASDNHWKAGIASLLTELQSTGQPPGAVPVTQ
jgi:hypothetical protein